MTDRRAASNSPWAFLKSAGLCSFGAIWWLALWGGINTGPWNLDLSYIERSWTGFFEGVRAAFPLAVLFLWIYHLALRGRSFFRSVTAPEGLWLLYGVTCLISSIYAEPWFYYGYWGLAYLSAFAATEMYLQGSPSVRRAEALNRLNWLLTTVVLVIVVWVARGQLLVRSSIGATGYGLVNRMPTVAGMAMVRSSGMSRMAAVPATVAFAEMWYTRGASRIIWLAILISSAYIVWIVQSRGSLGSFAITVSFMMVLLGGRARRVGVVALMTIGAALILGFISHQSVYRLVMFATRGERGAVLEAMSGRGVIYRNAWAAIKAAPILGYGPQADRQFGAIGNAQDGLLYALLCGGFIGGSAWFAGLVMAWLYLWRIAARMQGMPEGDRRTLTEVAGMMMFFTLRSIPENCAALFSVDLMVQLPAVVYLGVLHRELNASRARLRRPANVRAAAPRIAATVRCASVQ